MSEMAPEAPQSAGIDVQGALEALEAAGGMPETFPAAGSRDPWHRDPETGQFASKPEEAAPPVAEDAATTETRQDNPDAEGEGTQAETTEEEVSFTHIPDEALTPELLQMKRSLQADYTRKMQEAAPWRKLGEEFEVESPDDLRSALEAYSQLSDPTNWPRLHAELSQYLQSQGLSPREADAVAGAELNAMAQPPVSDDEWEFDDEEGPDLSPITQQLQAQQRQIEQLTQFIQQERQQRQQEAQLAALAQRIADQENQIRQAYKHYQEEDIEAIYDLMGDDGDLLGAQRRYESIIGRHVGRYLASKQSAQAAPAPVPGAGVVTSQEAEKPMDLDEAHRAALAHVAALERDEAQGGGY